MAERWSDPAGPFVVHSRDRTRDIILVNQPIEASLRCLSFNLSRALVPIKQVDELRIEFFRLFHTLAIPEDHHTVWSWIVGAYALNKRHVIHSLSKAKSWIALSYDEWKSNMDFLGVIVYYLDEQY